jgi:hypothetical protein
MSREVSEMSDLVLGSHRGIPALFERRVYLGDAREGASRGLTAMGPATPNIVWPAIGRTWTSERDM